MSKTRFPLALIVILFLSFALGHAAGLIVAVLVVIAGYLLSVRWNPRVVCRKCDGKSRYTGWLYTWAWHWCHQCGGTGRQIRWGAARWGTEATRTEAARNQLALRNATARRR